MRTIDDNKCQIESDIVASYSMRPHIGVFVCVCERFLSIEIHFGICMRTASVMRAFFVVLYF